jgi:hypothetical protein
LIISGVVICHIGGAQVFDYYINLSHYYINLSPQLTQPSIFSGGVPGAKIGSGITFAGQWRKAEGSHNNERRTIASTGGASSGPTPSANSNVSNSNTNSNPAATAKRAPSVPVNNSTKHYTPQVLSREVQNNQKATQNRNQTRSKESTRSAGTADTVIRDYTGNSIVL